MSLLIVSTCVGTLIELFRVVPLFQAAVRAHIGRRLTEIPLHDNLLPQLEMQLKSLLHGCRCYPSLLTTQNSPLSIAQRLYIGHQLVELLFRNICREGRHRRRESFNDFVG